MQMIKSFSQTYGYVTTGSAAIGFVASADILINIPTSKKRIQDLSLALFYGLASLNLFPGSARIGAAACILRSTPIIYEIGLQAGKNLSDYDEYYLHEKSIGAVIGVSGLIIQYAQVYLLALVCLGIVFYNPVACKAHALNVISTIPWGSSKLYQSLPSLQRVWG